MLHMPSGQEDFKQLRENRNVLYVDKTYFIKEWWESSYDKVTLITRPRFFGKTINLTMIDYFFSNRYKDLKYLFNDLFIIDFQHIMNDQGTYPVIFLNFSDIKTDSPTSIKKQIKFKIWQAYLTYKERMLESGNLDTTEKRFIMSIDHEIDDDVAVHSIQTLCSMLSKVYNDQQVIVLLDDYDSILMNSWSIEPENMFLLKDIKDFYINFITSTFKNNRYLKRGLITGVMNIPLFHSFMGANNIKVYTTFSNKYLNCFGFIHDELFKLTQLFQMTDRVEELEKWYDGYTFGNNVKVSIFNPFSISQFFNESSQFVPFWFNTSDNAFLRDILAAGPFGVRDAFIKLVQGKSIKKRVKYNYPLEDYESKNGEAIYNLLYSAGYLTLEKEERKSEKFDIDASLEERSIMTLKLPNLEIKLSFIDLINEWFDGRGFFIDDFFVALANEDVETMQDFMQEFYVQSQHIFNRKGNKPHLVLRAFMLGLATHANSSCYVKISKRNHISMADRKLLSHRRANGGGYFKEEDKDSRCFYGFLQNLDEEEGSKSVLLAFIRFQPLKYKDLPTAAHSILDRLHKSDYVSHLEKHGFDTDEMTIYGISFSEDEIHIIKKPDDITSQPPPSASSPPNQPEQEQPRQQEIDPKPPITVPPALSLVPQPRANSDYDESGEEEEEEDEEGGFDDRVLRNLVSPKFDHKAKNKLRENDEVFVIDVNGVDLWDAVISHKGKNNVYYIHYPEFPDDDEQIKGVSRILVKSRQNTSIFEQQEEVRRRKEEERDKDKKGKNERDLSEKVERIGQPLKEKEKEKDVLRYRKKKGDKNHDDEENDDSDDDDDESGGIEKK